MPSLSLPQARADILTALVEEPRERCRIAAQTQDASQLEQLVIALQVAVWQKDGERGRELLAAIKQMEAAN